MFIYEYTNTLCIHTIMWTDEHVLISRAKHSIISRTTHSEWLLSTNIMPSCPCQQKSCVTVSSWPHIIQNTLLVDHKVFVSCKTQTPLCILKFTLYSLHSTTKLNGTSGDAYIFGNYYVTVRADQSSASKHGPVCHEYEAIGVKMKQKRQDVTCHRLQKNSLEQICCTGFPSFHSTYYFEFLNVLNSWVHP